jgi:hypothetical protein
MEEWMFTRLNAALEAAGGRITSAVGTMWCAIAFACIALVSLPGALATHDVVSIVAWVAQTFLQLVLLSVIMVGQDLASRATAQQIRETHEATMSEFKLAKKERKLNGEEIRDLKAIAEALHVHLTGSEHPTRDRKHGEPTPDGTDPQQQT